MFDRDQLAGLLAALRAAPHCDTTRLALADWYGEHGDATREWQCRQGSPPLGLWFLSGYGSGTGYGYGYGDDDGYGYGSGTGYGYGYGDDDGYGYGTGTGYGDLTLGDRTMPEPDGKNWLCVLPHGWVICCRVVEQDGPFTFRTEGAVVICRTGGVPWDELADGGRRELATYRLWGDVRIGPQFVMSRPWKGKLPVVK